MGGVADKEPKVLEKDANWRELTEHITLFLKMNQFLMTISQNSQDR